MFLSGILAMEVTLKWCICPNCNVKQLEELRNNKYFRNFFTNKSILVTFRKNYLITLLIEEIIRNQKWGMNRSVVIE
jgi:hypothetical protein